MVIGHGQVAVFRRGVAPGDDKYRMSIVREVFDEGIVGGKIKNIILHDPGRDNEDRLLVDLLRCWGVLDQFEEMVAKHDLAWSHGDLFAGTEILCSHGKF